MKVNMDDLRDLAGRGAEVSGEVGEAVEEAAEEAATDAATGPQEPVMDVSMGPDGTNVGVRAPMGEMSAQEAIQFAQEIQGPDLSEQVVELLKDPQVRQGLATLWYGPEGPGGEQQPQQPQTKRQKTVETEGGNMNENTSTDGGQQTTVEVDLSLVDADKAVDVTREVFDLMAEEYPDMTAEELVQYADLLYLMAEDLSTMKPDMKVDGMKKFAKLYDGKIRENIRNLVDEYGGEV